MLVTLGFKGEKTFILVTFALPARIVSETECRRRISKESFFLSLGVPFQVANKMTNESQYWEIKSSV